MFAVAIMIGIRDFAVPYLAVYFGDCWVSPAMRDRSGVPAIPDDTITTMHTVTNIVSSGIMTAMVADVRTVAISMLNRMVVFVVSVNADNSVTNGRLAGLPGYRRKRDGRTVCVCGGHST